MLTRRLQHSILYVQGIWDHSGNQRKEKGAAFPGAPDKYRETVYRRDPSNSSFRVAYTSLLDDES